MRIGNAASRQRQWDVYGEVLDTMFQCRRAGLPLDEPAWHLERALLSFLADAWTEPDSGIWETRGRRQHFTHSKMMAWVAVDRAVKSVERFGLEGPAAEWRARRAAIHAEVCRRGFDPELGSFVMAYGSKALDAALLMMPLVGFLPATDPRVRGTVERIQRDLVEDGLVMRYSTGDADDGLPAGEGAFLACSFWLADNLALLGRRDEAAALFERLLALRNDVGLLSEEYDAKRRAPGGELPAGLLARRPREHRAEPHRDRGARLDPAHELTARLTPGLCIQQCISRAARARRGAPSPRRTPASAPRRRRG